ncbi:MAG: dienelactone hydrolase family protein [Clostridia bacterium]|nr:dienelactone hydrolase family protein [Clostridia bacterium]
MYEQKQFKDLKYLISLPEEPAEGERFPLVIFLHGAGTRSENTALLERNSNFVNLYKRQQARGYVLLAPLCSVNNWNEVMPTLLELVDTVRNAPYIDSKRVHLTGNSMGGYGTWELSSLRPEWFASAMPVCGGGIPWMAGKLVDLPIRTFHGLCDPTVDPIESLQMAKAVNKKGGHAELILFPELAHNCWDRVYSTEANYDWLLKFTTDRDKSLYEDLKGEIYG